MQESSLFAHLTCSFEPEMAKYKMKETRRSCIRRRHLFEPRLLKNDEDDTIISYTHIDDQFQTTLKVYNISKGRDIAQLKGA